MNITMKYGRRLKTDADRTQEEKLLYSYAIDYITKHFKDEKWEKLGRGELYDAYNLIYDFYSEESLSQYKYRRRWDK